MCDVVREVDRKREELRVMVGERYRDLIEAADTIHKMRECTSSVIQSVDTMQMSCRGLKLGRLQDRAVLQESAGRQMTANTAHLAVAAGIKLLTAVPEQIWAAVEADSWSDAAQLYLVAQHVHTGLQADQGLSPDKIQAWFPVISRQWDVLQQLHTSLVSSCKNQLSVEQLDQRTAVDCMIALMLLCNHSVHQTFTILLHCRSDSLRQVLTKSRSVSAVSGVTTVSRCVQSTVDTLQYCSDQLGPGLQNITCSDTPTVNKIPSSILGPTARYLPGPVLQFRPKLSSTKDIHSEIQNINIAKLLKNWLDSSLKMTGVELKAMFKFVDSVEGLKKVREAVIEVVGEESIGWLKEVSLWEVIFRKLIDERMMEIVSKQLEDMMETAAGDVEDMMTGDTQLEFVWTDSPADLGAVWGKGRAEKIGLQMKCWGWNSQLQDIWRQLDTCLDKLLVSIQDHPDILSRCRDVTGQCVTKLIQNVSDTSRDAKHVSRSRVLQSFLHLVPNITKLLTDTTEKVKIQIQDQQQKLLTDWLTSQVSLMTSTLDQLTSSECLQTLPAWDEVKISETGDSGEVVTSTISIPSSPSQPLMTSILDLASSVHDQHPTSLPPSLLLTANTLCLDTLVAKYQTLSQETLTQNFALQLLFDINFVQTLIVSRDSKDQYQSRMTSIISSFESNIDPFDLSVFTPHLHERVKTSCVRHLTSLACLVPKDRVSIISSYKSIPSDNHNILNISTQTCSRFQLLPLAPVLTNRQSIKSMLTPSSINLDSSSSSKSPRFDSKSVQQTAAQFFGSMPSWFGNNS